MIDRLIQINQRGPLAWHIGLNRARLNATLSPPDAPHHDESEASMDTMRKLLARFSALPIGTNIAAAMDFGPIVKGQWGIVTGHQRTFALPWCRARYMCTFLGGMRVTASHTQIITVLHGRSLLALEDPFWFVHSPGLADRPRQHEIEVRRYISRAH
jgi:hypothetical protein